MTSSALPIGVSYGVFKGRVDADAAIAYALATNDPNEKCVRGDAVPPLFTVSFLLDAVHEAVQATSASGGIHGSRGGVHGEHQVRWFEPVRAGMVLEWQATTFDATQTPAGAMVTQQLVVRADDGTPLVEHLWSTLFMGGVIDGELGPGLPDHSFPAEARGHLISTTEFDVPLDQGFRYAGASGDRVGHSIDDEIARSEGFPRKLVQGLCTFAMCSGAVVELSGGDPGRLRRLAGRFARPMFPNQRLSVSCYDAGRTSEGRRIVVFEAQAGGQTVIKHGWAELDT